MPTPTEILSTALNSLPDGPGKKPQSAEPRWLPAVRVILSSVYRIGVAGGGLALVCVGVSPWFLLLLLPILLLGPDSK
jgi:hypothetical protein